MRRVAIITIVVVLGLTPGLGMAQAQQDTTADETFSTVAHIDTGINPYHEAFEDDSKLAQQHPSTYIDGYPENATRLDLHLKDDLTYKQAFYKDLEEGDWNLTEGELYWIPGTKIIGAVSFGSGGVYCPVSKAPPAYFAGVDPTRSDEETCQEHEILDDFGHGTMTATRMAGNQGSLCPDCRIVTIEGLGSDQVEWAAERGWIDAQTNSWASIFGDPVLAVDDAVFGNDFDDDIEKAADEHLTFFASGNGAGGFFGFTPWPTLVRATHQEGVISVGAHDNGHVAHWQGTPPHVVTDGFRPLSAASESRTAFGPLPMACCTSAASPYAAGFGARIVQEARTILDDHSEGVEDGVLVEGTPPADLTSGPLADGNLTVDEARQLIKHIAQPQPEEGMHDGKRHWLAEPVEPDLLPHGPGSNAFCPGCWTLPAQWSQVPEGAPTYTNIGYGALNEFTLADAIHVLEGDQPEPARDEVDAFFEAQQPARDLVHEPDQFVASPSG